MQQHFIFIFFKSLQNLIFKCIMRHSICANLLAMYIPALIRNVRQLEGYIR